MNDIVWYKINLSSAIGNTATDHISMAKRRKKYGEKIGLVYDERYSFQKDIIECNPYIDVAIPFSQFSGNIHTLKDPTEGMSWNYLVHNREKIQFKIPEDYVIEAKKIANNVGINIESDKIVTIHVREPGYKYYRTRAHEPERFVDKGSFIELTKVLIRNGYKVVRVGGNEATDFLSCCGFYDLTTMENKRFLLELFFISISKLLVDCDSGIWPFGVSFNVPTLQTNSCHGQPNMGTLRHWFPWEEGHLTLNKHVYKNNIEVDVRQAIMFFNRERWKNTGDIVLKDNTLEELIEGCDVLLKNHYGENIS